MPDIVVMRGGGNSQGEDVVDSLLTTVAACMARGRIELDEGSGLHSVELNCVYRDGLLLGALVELYDPVNPVLTYGKITSITHTVTVIGVTTKIKLLVPSSFLL